jgi:hypothetical protein
MSDIQDDQPIMEPEEERVYSYREKALRDFFVQEYLVDYDETAAATRVGYGKAYAKEYGRRFMNEPYVLREIAKREGSTSLDADDPEAEKKRIIAGLKREANYRGPGSSQAARVAALSRLANLMGMDPKDKTKDPIENELEGAFVVPGVMTPEQWAAAAKKQQEELTSGVVNVMPTPPSIN